MHSVLREEVAQATVEYAIVTVALLSIVLADRKSTRLNSSHAR